MIMREFQFIPLEHILAVPYPVYAHTNESRTKETLQEHTGLCEKYFIKMYSSRKLDVFFHRFANIFPLTENPACERLYYKMLDNVITFHDTGKINPEFQRQAMENPLPKSIRAYWLPGKKHSMFSAVIYLNHFMAEIDESEIDKESKINLKGICLINAFVISRHHSDLGQISAFMNEYEPGGSGSGIMEGLKNRSEFLKNQIYGKSHKYGNSLDRFRRHQDQETVIAVYTYTRFLYSLLVSCDYYATTEYKSGVCIKDYGNIGDMYEFAEIYENADLTQAIRAYEKGMKELEGINKLRSEMFLEVERNLKKNMHAGIYFLEAPTGSGKSNMSMNLSFQLLQVGYQKIYYVYPFNTLVDQNMDSLEKIFGKDSSVFQKITILNSNTPIKQEKSQSLETEELEERFEKALLDRQFLNYPFVLTTHVSLFQTMFGSEREAVFGFSQLQDSIIILDEIQSYKNTIWSEIIIFLKAFGKLLNMKVIIMSATLPDLNYLTGETMEAVQLLQQRDRYFMTPIFKERVKVSYELLTQEMSLGLLRDHIIKYSSGDKKIVVEFIKKKRAYEFMDLLSEDERLTVPLYFISGDDNRADRSEKLKDIKSKEGEGLILIATQVIEAGVDIDMDIGYKDISKLDSEEQFLGRINRSCKREGLAFFFHLDDAKRVYTDGDYRMNPDFILLEEEMQEILESKKFSQYYLRIMQCLRDDLNCSLNDNRNLSVFFDKVVKRLNFPKIAERMKLIEESNWDMSVFLVRNIEVEHEYLNGKEIWNEYKALLQDYDMNYAEKQVKLSMVRSKMNYFIYQIKKNSDLPYSDKIGELYCIDNGEEYFMDGRLNKEKLEKNGGMFLDWG